MNRIVMEIRFEVEVPKYESVLPRKVATTALWDAVDAAKGSLRANDCIVTRTSYGIPRDRQVKT